MRVRASSASAVTVSLLVNDVFAAVHGRHEMFHRKRTHMDVMARDDVIETKTEVIYVTVDWPSGETLGVEYPPDMPTPVTSTPSPSVAAVPSYTESSVSSSVTDTYIPADTSVAPASTSTPNNGAQFVQDATTSTPPAAVPTTMATVVVAAAGTVAAAAPAPASTSPVSTSNKITTDTSKKRGLAFNEASLTSLFTGGSSEVSWCYNWVQTGPGTAASLEYIPMLWNNDASRTQSWSAAASAAIASGTGHLFSFNEPDLISQANMDVGSAVAAYKQYMQPFAGQAKLGAPAVTNGEGQMGLQYMQNFISECTGCTIDFVNIHWYDSATNFAYFKGHVQDAHTKSGGLPVWITEFAASGSEAEQQAFLEVVLPWLDAQPYVERYAYFMAKDGVLVSGNSLSSLGSTFTDYVSSTISSLIANI